MSGLGSPRGGCTLPLVPGRSRAAPGVSVLRQRARKSGNIGSVYAQIVSHPAFLRRRRSDSPAAAAQPHTCHFTRSWQEKKRKKIQAHVSPPTKRNSLLKQPRVRAEWREREGGGGILEKVLQILHENKPLLPNSKCSEVSDLVGEEFHRRSQPPAFYSRPPKSAQKTRSKGTKRADLWRTDPPSLSPLEGQKSVPFPPQNTTSKASQRHIKGNSEGRRRREEGGGAVVTYHRSKSSPLKLNSCCCAFLSSKEEKKA